MEYCHLPGDVLYELSTHIPDGATWKSFVQCCKYTNQFNTLKAISKYANKLAYFLFKNPEILKNKIKSPHHFHSTLYANIKI